MDFDASMSSPSLWYTNYKGAVYPVSLLDAPALLDANRAQRKLKTLVECCCEKIVQDSNMTRVAATDWVPKELQDVLMKVC